MPAVAEQRPLDVALVHHLPSAGGAPRVLAEYVARRPAHLFTVYTRMSAPAPGEELITLPDRVVVRRFALPEPRGAVGRLRALRAVPAQGRELAAVIDAVGHDAVFAFPSVLVQTHEVLAHLRTPALAWIPEPLRALHEDAPAFGPSGGLRGRLVRAGLDPYERLRGRLDRAHVRAAPAVVTHSRFTADALQRIYGVHADVVPLGVDAQTFTPPSAPRDRSVLSVGAFHPLKGHQDVIAALATIPARRRPPLTIVGDRGDLAGALTEHARALGVALRVRRAIALDELVAEYRRAGVVAAAMVREPFGLVALESMATGAPVVAVDEGGLRETISHGETGLLVARSAPALGAALLRVLDDSAFAGRLGAAGRLAAEREWTWERTADGFDGLLRAVADRPR